MKKLFLSFFIILFVSSFIFASPDPYSTCDKETKAKLEKIDELIEAEKYKTAFTTCVADNEYLLAKKVEIAIRYFGFSLMHQMFGFKDLEPGETLHDVRTASNRIVDAVVFDPVKEIEGYTKSHGEKTILDYALGLYYMDVAYRYPNQWLISQEELLDKASTYLQKAVDKNCYNEWSIGALTDAYIYSRKFEECAKLLEYKSTVGELSINDIYMLGYSYGLLGEYDKAIPYMEKAIEGYEKGTQYLNDAYAICSELYIFNGNYKEALNVLKDATKEFPDDYKFIFRNMMAYARLSNKKEALKYAQKLFDMYPENSSSVNMIVEDLFNAGKQDWLPGFFDSNIKKYKKQPLALQCLYFYYSSYYLSVGDKPKAIEWAQKAKKQFEDNGTLTDEIAKMLDDVININ